MRLYVLANGVKIIHEKKNSNATAIQVNVAAGSNDETKEEAGISHYIEHMLFEGTTRRPNSFLISNEIERLGGELNAATSNDRTYYYAKVLNKHAGVALDVLSDIVADPLFSKDAMEREKGVVIDEIKLVNDQPRFYQWVFFESKLFKRHPVKNPVYGNIPAIRAFDRNMVLRYFRKFYTPDNMTVTIVGGAEGILAKAKKAFSVLKGKAPKRRRQRLELGQKANTFRKKKGTLQSYVVMGFRTQARAHEDSYCLDLLRASMGRGQSGRIFKGVRTKHGLAYDVGVLYNPGPDYGYFAVYINTNEKNVQKVRRIVLEELNKPLEPREFSEAKDYIEGEFLLQAEDNQKLAELIASWDQAADYRRVKTYIKDIKRLKKAKVDAIAQRYFKDPVMTVIS